MKNNKKDFIVFDDLIEDNKRKSNIKFIIVFIIVSAIVVFGCIGLGRSQVFKTVTKYFRTGGTAYGDVNEDGNVKSDDALMILNHISGNKKLTKQQQKIADVDGNDKINQIDAQLVLKKAAKLVSKFPIEEKKYGYDAGDVNQDGKITSSDTFLVEQYLSNRTKLTGYQSILADVSGDSKVTALDAEIISYYVVGKIKSFPIINPKTKYYSLGDVNEDGKISAEDASMISKSIAGTIELKEIQKLAADVTQDGKITMEDSNRILEIMVGKEEIPEVKDSNEMTDNKVPADPTPNQTTGQNNSNNNNNNNNSSSNNNNNNTPSNPSTPTQSTPSTPSNPTPQIPFIYGDVDGNGIVESNDALQVEKYSQKLITLDSTQFKKADVNGDGIVDNFDAILILKYVSKLIPTLAPGTQYYIPGDIDGNKIVNSSDLLLLEKYIQKLITFDELQKRAADLNQDGVVDASDMLILMRKLVS